MSEPIIVERVLIASEHSEILDRIDELRAWMAEQVPGVQVDVARSLAEALSVPSPDAIFGNAQPWIADLVRARPSIRWIHLISAGADRLLELDLPFDRLRVSKSSGVHSASIPEFVIGAALYFTKGFDRFAAQQRRGEWQRAEMGGLEGATLGIVGLGTIGTALARKAKAFDMRVIGSKRHPCAVDGVDRVVGPDGTREVMAAADVVAVILPLTPSTRGLVDRRAIEATKPGAVFVNVGRGQVVDEAALTEALRAGRLRGAVLDVFDEEPLPASSPLWAMENVLITPHVSGSTPTYMRKAVEVFGTNVRALAEDGSLRTPVQHELGY